MASFYAAAEITLGADVEGGWANVRQDRGGETYRGISRNNHPKWSGWIKIDAIKNKLGPGATNKEIARAVNATQIHTLLNGDVLRFYYNEFWLPVRADDIGDQGVASELFDHAVNSGPRAGVEALQRALNILNRCDRDVSAWPDIDVDGKVGPATLRVVAEALKHDADALLLWMVFVRGSILVAFMEKRESQEIFARGWGKRLAGFIRRLYAVR